MDDGEVTEETNDNVVLADILDRRSSTDLRKECLAVDQRAIGVRVHEIGGKVGIKPIHIGLVDRADVVAVEISQSRAVLLGVCHGPQLPLPGVTPHIIPELLTALVSSVEEESQQLKIEPGGIAAFHSHAQRPAFTYVISGTLLEHRKDGPDRTYKAGEVLVESTEVEHWAENNGSEPVMLVSVDLFKE
jgi:quercetin dioxygenase-like cupin family protein